MTDPFDPRDAIGDDPVERELRRTLTAHARDVPDASALTERLLAAGDGAAGSGTVRGAAGPRRRTWSAWGTPLVAAACVAAIVGIVLAVVRTGPSQHRSADAVGSAPVPAPVSTVTRTVAPLAPSSASSTSLAAPTTSASAAGPPLQDLHVLDLTFTGTDSGWALGSADCLTGSGRCTALLRTTDGTTWTGHPNTPFSVPGDDTCPAASCVTHIRFADPSVGYAFGPDALYLTVDGAQHWTRQSGGADALETLDNNVIRVSALGTSTPSLQTSAVGDTSWTSRSTAGFPSDPVGVSLTRSGQSAVLAFTRLGATNGSPDGRLLRSADDGATWTSSGADPCAGSRTGDVLATSTTTAGGAVVLACATQASQAPAQRQGLTLTSTDGGATFGASPAGRTPHPAQFLGAASGSVQLVVPTGSNRLYRSTDSGASWSVVAGVTAADVRFLGFESATVGRLVTDDGQTIWTTRDAGRSWTRVSV